LIRQACAVHEPNGAVAAANFFAFGSVANRVSALCACGEPMKRVRWSRRLTKRDEALQFLAGGRCKSHRIAAQRFFERLRLAGAEGFPPQLPDPINGWLIKTPPVQTNVNPTL
jgi:hypothetical protein